MIEQPSYQLRLELDLSDEDGRSTFEYERSAAPLQEGEEGWVSPEEAKLREAEARRLFEGGEKPGWFEEYERLVYGGWPFRVAMYIAWAASPRSGRKPDNLGELANMMGLKSPRAIHRWRAQNAEIERQVAIMQAAPLFKHRADAIQALVESASDPDYRHAPDRRTLFTMTGDLEENINLWRSGAKDDLSQMTDDELAAMAATLTPEGRRTFEYERSAAPLQGGERGETSPPAPLHQGVDYNGERGEEWANE